MINPRVSLDGTVARLLDADGSALVIRAKADDYRTDPAGADGPGGGLRRPHRVCGDPAVTAPD
jgi:Cu/Zn superoxide dismutase